jgi:hypothetical protein
MAIHRVERTIAASRGQKNGVVPNRRVVSVKRIWVGPDMWSSRNKDIAEQLFLHWRDVKSIRVIKERELLLRSA